MAIEAAPTGMMLVDSAGRVVQVNSRLCDLFGYSRAEILALSVEDLVPARLREAHPRYREGFMSRPDARPMGAGRDLYGLRKDGLEVPIEIGLNPLTTTEGTFVLSSVVDITERKRAVDQMRASLREKETLLREVHHRVKNNLQVITSLINLQAQQIEDASVRAALEECKARVQSIALIHENLYQSNDYARVPFAQYARTLAEMVLFALQPALSDVEVLYELGDVVLPVDQAIPCGLILTELITNAVKHAFPSGRAGKLTIAMTSADKRVELVVKDDGIGLPDSEPSTESRTVGMQLVRALADQLEATLNIDGRCGTTVSLHFDAEAQP